MTDRATAAAAGLTRDPLARFRDDLTALAGKTRRRALAPRAGHDFASNDYLGLASSPELAAAVAEALARNVPIGAGGSRLLRGNHAEHEALEAEAAAWFGAARCLYFTSGYTANLALFATLPQRGDLVVFDELSHASARAGLQAGRAAAAAFHHNDAEHAEHVLRQWRRSGGTGAAWIAAESLYSMDGDRAPVADLLAVAERYDGFLVLDEAHATGVLGEGGRGLAAALAGHASVIALHTCGKALGVSGALVAADAVLIDFLVNRAKPFIYATAPSPLLAATLRAALRLVAAGAERRQRLASLVGHAGRLLTTRLGVPSSGSHIMPVIVGDDARAVRLASRLQAAGFDCRAIRPPTVPAGTARLRVSITLNVDQQAITDLVDAMAAAGLGDAA